MHATASAKSESKCRRLPTPDLEAIIADTSVIGRVRSAGFSGIADRMTPIDEIAHKLNISPSTVGVLLSRALNKLHAQHRVLAFTRLVIVTHTLKDRKAPACSAH